MIASVKIAGKMFYVDKNKEVRDYYSTHVVNLDELIADMETSLEELQKIRFDISIKDADVKRQSRKFTAEKHNAWWEQWKDEVKFWLERSEHGMRVKFSGTKDGSGYREIIEINGDDITGFKIRPARRIRVQMHPNKPYVWVECDEERTLDTTTNGIEKITHIKVGGKYTPIKEYIKRKAEWSE